VLVAWSDSSIQARRRALQSTCQPFRNGLISRARVRVACTWTYPTSEIPRELDRFLWGGGKPGVNIQDIYGTPGEDFSAFKNSRRDLVVVNRTILAEENFGLLRFIPRRIWQAISLHHSLNEMKNVWVASDNNIMPTLERLERRFPGIKNEILRRSAQVNPKRNRAMRRYVALISYFAPVFLLLHLIALWCLRNRNSRIFRFALFSLLAIGCNLIVYATLSNPHATRLYDRLGWLSALVAALWASSELDKQVDEACPRGSAARWRFVFALATKDLRGGHDMMTHN